jgi:hypothetical protein
VICSFGRRCASSQRPWRSFLKGRKMKQLRSNIWIVLLGILLMMSVNSAAQGLNQTDQKKKTEAASCSMDSCCCHSDSCSMKKEGATASNAKEHCCCGGGESCDMKTNKSMENHAAGNGCCCGGDSCDMESKEKKQNHGSSESCCCDMKMKHKDTEQTKS